MGRIRIDGTGATGVSAARRDPAERPLPQQITDPSAMVAMYHAAGDARRLTKTNAPRRRGRRSSGSFHEGDYENRVCPATPAFLVSAPMGLGDMRSPTTAPPQLLMKMEDPHCPILRL